MEGAKPMEYWLSALFCFMEQLFMVLLFDAFFERRVHRARYWGIFLLFVIWGVLYSTLVHTPISALKLLNVIAQFLLFNLILYRGRFGMRLLIVVLGYAFMYLVALLINSCVLSILTIDYEAYVNNRALYVLVGIGNELFIIMLALLLRHFHRPHGGARLRGLGVILLFPLAALALMFPLYNIFFDRPDSFFSLMLSVTILIFANAGVIVLIDWMEESTLLREQALAASERLAAQQQSVEALSAAYTAQRKLTHDFRHHLSTLAGLLPDDGIEAAQYLKEMQEQQTERALNVNSHHAAIDAVLNQKAQYAQNCRIDMRFEVNDLSALCVPETDCTVVLANLLDNAIEACMKLPQEQRWIEAKVVLEPAELSDPGILLVSIRNASPPVKIVNGRINTTKPEPALHGFGIPNIKEILSRHGAESVMLYRDQVFQFTFEWPNLAA